MMVWLKCPYCKQYHHYLLADVILCVFCGKEFNPIDAKQSDLAEV